MSARKPPVLVLAQLPILPTGNVVLVGAAAPPTEAVADEPGGCWVIQDAAGATVGVPQPTHADAVRELGRLALRGAALPLRVIGPDGRRTGDQLG